MTSEGKTRAEIACKLIRDTKTARKWQKSGAMPSASRRRRRGRTRKDPFENYFPPDGGLAPERMKLDGITLFRVLRRQYPGKFGDNQLRTFQRRFRELKATEGKPREVFFPQLHFPGDLCASDFTQVSELGVTIQKQKFRHLLYHFVLTYSNWEHVSICPSESAESLSHGMQMALQTLGGVPRLQGRDLHRIQYRHIIDGLLRKPGAFMQYVYREDLYPSPVYRQAFDAWQTQMPGIPGVKQYLRTLKLAADEGEQTVEGLLLRHLGSGQPFRVDVLEAEIANAVNPASPCLISFFDRLVEMPQLGDYDQLLSEAGV